MYDVFQPRVYTCTDATGRAGRTFIANAVDTILLCTGKRKFSKAHVALARKF